MAALFAAAYVIVAPASLDLADHLFRAQLFRDEGFGLWNNLWYSGHHIVGYSVLFPAVSALLSPQLAGALAATGTAALFEPLARRHFGADAWLGAVLFGAATAIDLYTGRLAFAFGRAAGAGGRRRPAIGARSRWPAGWRCCRRCAVRWRRCSLRWSPPATRSGGCCATRRLTAALSGRGDGGGARSLPIGLLAVAFPEGGSEPFGFATMFPVLVLVALAFATAPRPDVTLRAGLVLYALATIVVYLVDSPIGSNIARLGTFLAAPMAALLWARRRPVLLAVAALPLLYVGWAAPVRDVVSASNDRVGPAGYYQPVLRFLRRESTPPNAPFRTEIPFTRFHWEAWVVAAHFPLARGWERQLDIADNPLFYSGHLTAATYEPWLHDNAIRFVAAPDAPLDYSAQGEKRADRHAGLPYLRLVMRSAHWRVYAVADADPDRQRGGHADAPRSRLADAARPPGRARCACTCASPRTGRCPRAPGAFPGRPLDPADARPGRPGQAHDGLLAGPDRRDVAALHVSFDT